MTITRLLRTGRSAIGALRYVNDEVMRAAEAMLVLPRQSLPRSGETAPESARRASDGR
jgi:hypothetical protein